MRFGLRVFTLALALLSSGAVNASAQSRRAVISGTVADENSNQIAGAMVSIVELNRATTTGKTGDFELGEVPAGRYTISVRRVGYTPTAMTIDVVDAPTVVEIKMESGIRRLEPVNITATRTPTTALVSPLATSVLTGDEVHREGGVSLAHSVARLAGVRNVSTGQQIGKPMIRGLFGPRILVLADGSRLEDYSWSDEDGPSIDARIAERIEVIRGPASVLYGSEAGQRCSPRKRASQDGQT